MGPTPARNSLLCMALRQTAAKLAALLLVSNGATTLAVARRVRRGPPATSGAPNRQSAQTRIRAPASISHPLASSPHCAGSAHIMTELIEAWIDAIGAGDSISNARLQRGPVLPS